MRLIGKNVELLNVFYQNSFLLNAQVSSMNLALNEANALVIEIVFLLRAPEKEQQMMLRITDVAEYNFNYKSDYTVYAVRKLKFLMEEELFYLSIDPEDELPKVSHTDKDVVRAKNVEGFVF